MARHILLSSLLGFALVLGGCAGSAPTSAPADLPANFPNHSAAQIRSAIVQGRDTLERFSGTARVRVRTPQQDRSFNADLRQRRADSLLMRVSLFGIEGGRLLLTRDSVFFYDTRKQTLRAGPLPDARQLLPIPLTPGRVFENLLGLLAPQSSVRWTVRADSAHYHLTGPNDRRHLTVDPARWRVVRYARTTPEGTLVEERIFSGFQSVSGVLIPHQVVFRRPGDDLMARIRYRQLSLNPEGLSFDLGAPPEVPRRTFTR